MVAYRYLLCDLLTDRPIAELPLSGVTFGRRVSRVGDLSGSMVANTPEQVATAKLLHAFAGRSALWVYRDSAVWWGGIPWSVVPSQGQRGGVKVDVSAATFDSYAHHRRLYTDKTYTAVDQGVIIPDLWRTIQADPAGNIGVVAEDQPTGVTRDRTYRALELARVGELVEQLGDVLDGPEHTIDVWAEGDGTRVKRLRLADRLGVIPGQRPRHVFERATPLGGRLLEWRQTRDATDCGTAFLTRGNTTTEDGNAGSAVVAPTSTLVERTDLLDAGWPRLDVTEDHTDVSDTATLQGYANAMANALGGAEEVNEYTVSVAGTGWHPNSIGEPVRLRLLDPWHDTLTDRTVRPVGVDVTPAERGQPERVKLILGEDET